MRPMRDTGAFHAWVIGSDIMLCCWIVTRDTTFAKATTKWIIPPLTDQRQNRALSWPVKSLPSTICMGMTLRLICSSSIIIA